MTTYNLSKGANNDIDGSILRNWVSNATNIHNLIIRDTGAATIENLFQTFHLSSAISIDLSSFNTSKVTIMFGTFDLCMNLVNISNFDTSNVTDMYGVFQDCYNVVDIPNFNTINVTNMSYTFASTNVVNLPNFNTSNVIDLAGLCGGCINLVNVPELNTSNVNNIGGAFFRCNSLSNESIQNIINMCLNSNITNSALMNLSVNNYYSPLAGTKFDSSYYSNRLTDLTNAGWSFEPYLEEDDEVDPIIVEG